MKTRMLAALILLLTSASVFAQVPPLAENFVNIATKVSEAAEPGTVGSFEVTFTTPRQTACTVAFTTSGVTPTGNYQSLGTSVTMPSGTASVDIVTPVDNFVVDGTRDVTVTVTGVPDCPSVKQGSSLVDTVTIADNDATLTVIKTVDNTGGGTAVAGDWAMDVTNSRPSSSGFPGAESPGTDVVIAAGTYSVDESGGPTDYDKLLGTGCSGSITAGATASCTITNTFVPSTTTTTTTTTAVPTTTTTAGSTTTTTAAPTTTTTAAPTTTTTAGTTTTTTAASTTTTAVATTTTTTTTAPTTTTTLPPGTPALTLVKTADPSTFDMEGVTINYSYLVTSTGNAAVIGPITVLDSRMTVACPPVDSVGNNDDNLDVGESLICTSSLVTSQADVILGYIFTSSVAEGANASSDAVGTNVPFATVGIPTLSEWTMIMLSFLLLLMGVGYLRKRKMI